MSFLGRILLRFTKSRHTINSKTVTALYGPNVKQFSYVSHEYPIYEIGGQQLVPLDAVQGHAQNFDAMSHYQRHARELQRTVRNTAKR